MFSHLRRFLAVFYCMEVIMDMEYEKKRSNILALLKEHKQLAVNIYNHAHNRQDAVLEKEWLETCEGMFWANELREIIL